MPTSGGGVPSGIGLLSILGMSSVRPVIDAASLLGARVSFVPDVLREVPDFGLALLARVSVDSVSGEAVGLAFFPQNVHCGTLLESSMVGVLQVGLTVSTGETKN